MSALVKATKLTRRFDVSKPWLNRVIERLPKAILTAVRDVEFEIPERTVYALVGQVPLVEAALRMAVVIEEARSRWTMLPVSRSCLPMNTSHIRHRKEKDLTMENLDEQ